MPDHNEFLLVFITQIQYLCFKWRHNGHTLAPPQLPTSWHQLCHRVQTTSSCTFKCELQFYTDDVVVFCLVFTYFFLSFPPPTPPPNTIPHPLRLLHPRMLVQSTSSATTRRARATTWWTWTTTACWTSTHRSPQSLLVSPMTLFYYLSFSLVVQCCFQPWVHPGGHNDQMSSQQLQCPDGIKELFGQ